MMNELEELAMLRQECGGWRSTHAKVESRLLDAEMLLTEAANFVSNLKLGVTPAKRDALVGRLRGFVAKSDFPPVSACCNATHK